jgi:hypothetical protein
VTTTGIISSAEARAGSSSLGRRRPGPNSRGLYLRTSMDKDKYLDQIALIRADEIVMDDGEPVANWGVTAGLAPLIADASLAGAGGLDTGSRTASTWLEAWAIRNPATDARALMLHRSRNYALDYSQLNQQVSQPLASVTGNQMLASSFVATTTGPVEIVDVFWFHTGVPAASQFWLELRPDNAGVPSSTVLARSDKFAANEAANAFGSAVGAPYRQPFRQPFSISSGTKYWVVTVPNYAINGTAYMAWQSANSGSLQYQYNGSTWSVVAAQTGCMRVMTTQNDLPVVMPSGYTQKALLGMFFNNSGNKFSGGEMRGRRYFWLENTGPLGGTTAQTPTFVDLGTVCPPHAYRVGVLGANSPAGTSGGCVSGVPDGYGMVTNNTFAGTKNFIATTSNGGVPGPIGDILTEYQVCYIETNGGGTFNIWCPEWEW